VYDVLGLVDRRLLHELCRAILDKDIPAQLRIVEDIVAGGKDLSQFVQEILQHFRNLLVCKTGEAARLLALPEDEIQVLSEQAGRFPLTHLIKLVEQFAQLTGEFDSQLAQRIALEALLIRISKAGVDVSIDTVLEKLLQLGEGHAPARGGPNPPEAGAPPVPRRAAPAKPRGAPAPAAEPEPLTLTADNLRQLWPAILERVREASLSLAVWLGQGVAAGIEGDTLVLQYAAGQTRARETVEQPDQRRALESALAASTRNVRTYRTELQAGAASPRETKAEYNPQQPFYPTVNPEEARKVMADPRIAQVLDVLKGRIADIRHDVSLAHREGD